MSIGSRIHTFRKAAGKTQADVARFLGVSREAVAQWEADTTAPKIDRLITLAAFLNVDAMDILSGSQDAEGEDGTSNLPAALHAAAKVALGPPDLPVRGSAKGGKSGVVALPVDQQPVDWTYRPPQLVGVRDAFAVFAYGDSMVPMYQHGQTLWIHPHMPVGPGNGVLVVKTNDEAFVKQFVRWSKDQLVLQQYGPKKQIKMPSAEIRHVYRVLGVLDLR
jgi:phage repressor protein C with HTH and peptisase S24 domain